MIYYITLLAKNHATLESFSKVRSNSFSCDGFNPFSCLPFQVGVIFCFNLDIKAWKDFTVDKIKLIKEAKRKFKKKQKY